MKRIINLFMRPKWLLLIIFMLFFGYPVGYFVLNSNHLDNNASIAGDGAYHGIGVYIINLNRSQERYTYIKDHVNALGLKFERIEAVDGSTLSTEEINEKVDLKSYKTFLGHYPKRGTIGCSLSHIKAFETFLGSNLEYAIIFEDDVSFDPSQVKVIIEDLIKNNKLWDIATLDISQHGLPLIIKNLTNNHLVVYATEVVHTGAYVINRVAAKKLLEKALPIKMPIDLYFARAWEFDIKFTGIENPRLIHQTFGDSDIAITERLSGEEIDVLDSLKRGMYKSQTFVIRFFYNLKLYLAECLQSNHKS